ncbi:MAG: aspartate aminotransferase family protein [Flammeovirgaceae bacterium]|nr:aspartate aminotransferase family protein [Flammeovirgaceae bacterium]MBE61344.1 aspartate aminotransferase family protein [Flammeovirgaceae bacterium]MBR10685.1 aspartate aminotransferase family protein [Rickettsiales bacterium]HCX23268.1 aspartate aminotransferase family protein [Cytophagales bacterium]
METNIIRSSFVQQGDTHDSELQKSKVNSLGSESQEWLSRDANAFLHQALSTPVMNVMKSAEGPYIYDLEGNQYLDLHGNGVHNVGYNNPEVISSIIHQLTDQLTFIPRRYTSIPTVRFAERLIGLSPEGLDRVLFCPGGSEAIEMAVMLAKHVTGNWKTISFWDQYHGNTMQAATLSGNEHFTNGMGPVVPGAFHVHYPNYYRNPWGLPSENREALDELYLDEIRMIFKHHPDIAAVVGTTISSTPYVPSEYFWSEVRKLCDQHGTMLIFDEIVCGLGRTGRLFACEHYVTPDVVVMGKSLGGGILPFAGILTKEEHNIIDDYSIGHYTHEKSPICAAAGLTMLNYMEKHQLVANAENLGKYILEGFLKLQSQYEEIGKVDGKGMLISIDLVKDRKSKLRNDVLASQVLGYCLDHGLSFKIIDGNVLALRPALIIDKSQATQIIDTISSALEHALKNQ